MPDFPATREAALERLRAFAPQAGRAYAAGRNTDFGPSKPQAVSMLSPYLRRRMITEREVVEEVLNHHTPQAAEKFIQEVFWHTYWKGWLEMRPSVWDHYLALRNAALADPPDGYRAAIEGRTGIDGFDDWARELVSTGWLHNHARMWFASIWIFTLKLPWQLGADFFYRHLIDADPASNTLSWRWVAGLHTKGKTYLARPDNIDKHTAGRFRPSGLAPFADALIEGFDTPDPLPPRSANLKVPSEPYALLLTSDDLHPESWPGYDSNPPALVIDAGQLPLEAELNSGQSASDFTRKAIAETAARLGRTNTQFVATDAGLSGRLSRLLAGQNLTVLAMPYATTGPSRAFLNDHLAGADVSVHEVKRAWDEHAWPHATAGFFKLKKKIPKLMSQAGLAP